MVIGCVGSEGGRGDEEGVDRGGQSSSLQKNGHHRFLVDLHRRVLGCEVAHRLLLKDVLRNESCMRVVSAQLRKCFMFFVCSMQLICCYRFAWNSMSNLSLLLIVLMLSLSAMSSFS